MQRWISMLFLMLHSTTGLRCIKNEIFQDFSIDEFDHDKLQSDLDSFTLSPITNDNLCRVSLDFSYHLYAGTLDIEFGEVIQGIPLADKVVQLDTMLTLQNQISFELKHYLEYACSNYDGCEKQFVLEHIEWFYKAKYLELQQKVEKLLDGPKTNQNMCVNEYNISQRCPSKTCVGTRSRKEKTYKHSCKVTETKFPLLHIITYINTDVNHEEQEFIFECHYNDCNGIGRLKEVQKIVEDYYDLSPLRKALGFKNKSSTIQSTLSYYSLSTEMIMATFNDTSTSFTIVTTEALSTKVDHLLSSPSSKTNTLKTLMICKICSILFLVIIN
ncbi:hypothetical protein I4U23_022383 [Adineta vaga]|nr:hypothetical protein I4U23_022383 [Adineta vaga]